MIQDFQRESTQKRDVTTLEFKKKFEASVARYRAEVVQTIREKRPLCLPMFSANGDDLLVRAACWEVLVQLCEDEGLDAQDIQVTAVLSEDLESMHESAIGIYSKGTASGVLDKHAVDNATLYQESLYEFSAALGVRLEPSVYEKSPKIWPTDKGPLKNVDADKINEHMVRIREMTKGRPLVVIGQAGSMAEKRFSDTQLAEVAATARNKRQGAFIVVVSDKHFLRTDLPKMLAKEKPAQFPIAGQPNTKYTPEQIEHFTQELNTTLVPHQENEIDYVAEITDINELLAYFRLAAEADMTDGYWMHLAASQDVPNLIALFTLFQAKKWASPETTVVSGDVVAKQQGEYIPTQWYHFMNNDGHAPVPTADNYGIERNDIQKFTQAVSGT